MAEDSGVDGVSAAMHRQTCKLHDHEGPTLCTGMLRKGGTCPKKAVENAVPGMMPTCKIHREQLKVAGRCRASLPCGFECGQFFEWKFHGFQLCCRHRQSLSTCYFLQIPQEMRLRVYQFLLPDKSIRAHWNSRSLRTDGVSVYTSILRINRQIHDEAAALLYSTRVFTIELFETGFAMCNTKYQGRTLNEHSHRVQDYQMQLMLLEQQNIKRLLFARHHEAMTNAEASAARMPAPHIDQRSLISCFPSISEPFKTLWQPPLNDRYFSMIRAFFIEIVFPPLIRRVDASSNSGVGISNMVKLRLYIYCDRLHRLIGRLQLIQKPIAHLQIAIKFGDAYPKVEEAFSATQFLLRPFRRLHSVGTPEIVSLTMKVFPDRERELLLPGLAPSAAEAAFTDYLKGWSKDLSCLEPTFQGLQVLEAYWKLENIVSNINEHCYPAETAFGQLGDLLHSARVAREADDISSFKKARDQVLTIWFDHVKRQQDFQSKMARSIEDIYDIVGDGTSASNAASGAGG